MQPSQIFKALRRRWYLSFAVLVAAIVVGAGFAASVGGAAKGTATVQILVDSPVSALVNLGANQTGLEGRAAVLAQAMSSNAVVVAIEKAAGVPDGTVTAQGPYSGEGELLDVATPSEARGVQLGSVKALYRLTIAAQQDLPIVTVQVQGPTPEKAGAVANSVLSGVNSWLATLTTTDQVKSGSVVHLRQLGDAQAGPINSSSGKVIGAIGAVAVLLLGILLILLRDPERRARRERERERAEELLDAALARNGELQIAAGTRGDKDEYGEFADGADDDWLQSESVSAQAHKRRD